MAIKPLESSIQLNSLSMLLMLLALYWHAIIWLCVCVCVFWTAGLAFGDSCNNIVILASVWLQFGRTALKLLMSILIRHQVELPPPKCIHNYWLFICCTMTCKLEYFTPIFSLNCCFVKVLCAHGCCWTPRNNARYLWKRIPQAIRTVSVAFFYWSTNDGSILLDALKVILHVKVGYAIKSDMFVLL